MVHKLISLAELNQIISTQFWVGFGIVLVFVSACVSLLLRQRTNSTVYQVNKFIISVSTKPFLFFLSIYLLQVALTITRLTMPGILGPYEQSVPHVMSLLLSFTEAITFFWLLFNVLNQGEIKLQVWLIKNNRRTLSILLPMVSHSLKAAIFFLMINMLVPELNVAGLTKVVLEKTAKVSLIVVIALLLVDFVKGLEKLIVGQESFDQHLNSKARKLYTQVRLLKKVLLTAIGVITVAAILMVFDSVRELGAGILTTAGIVSAIGAFASQKSLGRIFSGLQLAFTQPFDIGDTIVVDNEQGEVEEITLSYIVVKLWDLRRLILPPDYFTTRGLVNLTRDSSNLLGTVYFYCDYTIPVEKVRTKFKALLADSTYWDKKVGNLDVTDIKERSMELRAILSARDSSTLWKLRCEIREKLMEYIVENLGEHLSHERTANVTSSNNPAKKSYTADASYFKDAVREK